jgi:arylsulfatase A-like enzyme
MPSKKNAIVFVVDRLSAGMIGPYGNTWLETRNLNRLASQSLLFDFANSDSISLDTIVRSYWSGLHSMAPADALQAGRSLPACLSQQGIESTLLTDDEQVEQFTLSEQFSHRLFVPLEQRDRPAKSVEDSTLASITAAAIGQIEELAAGQLLWVHAAGMNAAWDAPLEFRNAFADEDDPIPPEFVDPPSRMLSDDSDPDEMLGLMHAYAGQVTLFDICLGAMLDAIDEQVQTETLFVLTSPRGFPLGEHQRVGAWDSSLYNESLSVPLMLRVPEKYLDAQRSQILAQPPDLFDTLLGWFEVPAERSGRFGTDLIQLAQGNSAKERDRVCSVSPSERALRTPAWFLRQDENEIELFVKPDDRWEMNNVVQRCPSVADEMLAALDEFQKWAESGAEEPLSELSDVLLHGLE